MSSISFFNQNIPFTLKNKSRLKNWILTCIRTEKKSAGNICFIFCNDEYLLALNQKHLKHNTYTDIITFDYSADTKNISGDIFISIPRVIENAKQLGIDFNTELNRVMIHGVLHIIGYNDKTSTLKKKMRAAENKYLSRL